MRLIIIALIGLLILPLTAQAQTPLANSLLKQPERQFTELAEIAKTDHYLNVEPNWVKMKAS